MLLVYIGVSDEFFPKLDISVTQGSIIEIYDEFKADRLLSTGNFVVLEDKHLYNKKDIILEEKDNDDTQGL